MEFVGCGNVSEAEFWDSGLKMLPVCGRAPEDIIVFIKPNVKRKIDLLMEKYNSREWLAYLTGKDFMVEDIMFPKQNASACRVDNVDFPSDIKDKIIGVIHSHHSMGSSFSGTDNEYINGNHDISIVVSHSSISGQVRWTTPCGGKMTVKAKVRFYLPTDFDEETFIKDVEEKMIVHEPIPITMYNRGWSYQDKRYYNPDVPSDDDISTPSLRDAMGDM